MISEAALQLAVDLAAGFVWTGYPYLGKPTVDLDGPFPLVTVWDDGRAVMLVVACTEDDSKLSDALLWAVMKAASEAHAGRAPCGTLAVSVGTKYWMNDEGVISSRPIKHILGGE